MIDNKKFSRAKKAPVVTNNTKYRPGDVVSLKVVRVNENAAFLDAGTGNTSDDIMLHKLQQTSEVNIGDEVKVYLYLDPSKRLTASMKLPKMREGKLGYVRVLSVTRDGGFVDIGAERGVWLRDLGDEADEVKDVFSDHTKIQVLAVRWLIPESFFSR